MLKNILVLVALFAAVFCNELSVLTVPKSLSFKNTGPIDSSDVGNLVPVALGMPNRRSSNWKGMSIEDPFSTPIGVIAINAHGCDSIHFDMVKPITYPINGADIDESLHEATERVEEDKKETATVDFNDGQGALAKLEPYFGEINCKSQKVSTTSLKNDNVQHKKFLNQMTCAYAFADKLANTQTVKPEFIELSFTALVDDIPAAQAEALKLLADAIERINAASVPAYGKDKVLVFSTATTAKRTKRAVEVNNKGDPIPEDINLAKTYSEDYPVIFNIILWFGVVIAFSLLAISYAIATMDPGRDSIIYRMTSNRIKKDN